MKCLVPLVLTISSISLGSEAPQLLNLGYDSRESSDHVGFRKFSFSSNPRFDLTWPYSDEPPKVSGWGGRVNHYVVTSDLLDYNLSELRGGYFQKVDEEWAWEAHLGVQNALTSESAAVGAQPTNRNQTFPSVNAKTLKTWEGGNSLEISLHRQLLHERVQATRGDLSQLEATGGQLLGVLRPLPGLKTGFGTKQDGLQDGNWISSSDLDVKYGISQSDLWFWLGAGAEYTTHRQKTLQYWSPSAFYSYGPRWDLAYAMNSWNFFCGGSFHATQEVSSGTGHYLSVGASYGDRNTTQARVAYEDIRSEQTGTEWTSKGISLRLTHTY